jgi:proteasome accessory factor C
MSSQPAEQRLARILAIVPWVAAADGPHISEVCARFGMKKADLLADLDLLLFCGVHPFTPDTLIEVDVIDDRVWLRFADYFRRPLRLTPPEGLALLSAGGALLAVPGADVPGADGPGAALGRALAKLEEALGVSRDGRSQRTVQPWRVFNRSGQWYLWGWCQQAEGERLFRIDRVRAATVLDEASPPRPPPPDDTDEAGATPVGETRAVYRPDASDPLVVLDLAPPAHWVVEQYPHEGVERLDDGRLRVRLRYNQRRWLERLLLRVGPDATLVEGDPTVRADAAARIRERYRT